MNTVNSLAQIHVHVQVRDTSILIEINPKTITILYHQDIEDRSVALVSLIAECTVLLQNDKTEDRHDSNRPTYTYVIAPEN